LLASHSWGRGFATEGAAASFAYSFEHLKLQCIVSITQPENARSLRVMQRIGLSPVGKTYWKGSDVVCWAIDRVMWERDGVRARVDGRSGLGLQQSSDREG
jgi:RimJ/RimL family protein N-acetyltransferase